MTYIIECSHLLVIRYLQLITLKFRCYDEINMCTLTVHIHLFTHKHLLSVHHNMYLVYLSHMEKKLQNKH